MVVLNGTISTFLAIFVLLLSFFYVFLILTKQLALTIGLGILHRLILLYVLLFLLGLKPFESMKQWDDQNGKDDIECIGNSITIVKDNNDTSHCDISETGHGSRSSNNEEAIVKKTILYFNRRIYTLTVMSKWGERGLLLPCSSPIYNIDVDRLIVHILYNPNNLKDLR